MCKFTRDNLHVVSGSDDKNVRIYDIPTESEVVCFKEHQVITIRYTVLVPLSLSSCYYPRVTVITGFLCSATWGSSGSGTRRLFRLGLNHRIVSL